jgi:hypothetical protein
VTGLVVQHFAIGEIAPLNQSRTIFRFRTLPLDRQLRCSYLRIESEAMKRWALLTVAAATSALFAHPSASSGIAPAAQGATGNARIVVNVILSGVAPVPAKIQTTADPYCAEAHQADPLFSQTVQVGADGALVDSLVFVSDGVSGTIGHVRNATGAGDAGSERMRL